MKLAVYDHHGDLSELDDVTAPTLMEAIRDAGMDLTAQCGGALACGTCHVYIDEVWLSHLKPPTCEENAMLATVEGRQPNSRISCQIELKDSLDGLTVNIAPGSAF
ncbi:MAG: (2Fe-2S)-binding protein [Mesorhizobium sp.]|uniref:2Fe-2S iron-sulfur cluster-binding protein n=1 Tax=Mesorhizobium sp. TaxID=1871066 RepID=UPI0012235A73|nr:2Fe-2S iron-sulfur cluster-binding protein [Mesorhizobium sp.]TIR52786.1 MAG: (2Fe-2S)-binding protein [Mesorhizobium sp.]